MQLKKAAGTLILLLLSLFSLHSQSLKAAVSGEPGNKLSELFIRLSDRSGIDIELIPLRPGEAAGALEKGIVDIAVLPDSERSRKAGLMQTPLWGTPFVLIGEAGFIINERTLTGLRTIGVLPDDEPVLVAEVIDAYSLDTRIQKARHYDLLVKIMASGRVSAIFIPMSEFERSIRIVNEDRDLFGRPFPVGFREDFLFLSRRRADRAAPLMDRLIQALDELKREGLVEELSLRQH